MERSGLAERREGGSDRNMTNPTNEKRGIFGTEFVSQDASTVVILKEMVMKLEVTILSMTTSNRSISTLASLTDTLCNFLAIKKGWDSANMRCAHP